MTYNMAILEPPLDAAFDAAEKNSRAWMRALRAKHPDAKPRIGGMDLDERSFEDYRNTLAKFIAGNLEHGGRRGALGALERPYFLFERR